jgi:hypothetical protein
MAPSKFLQKRCNYRYQTNNNTKMRHSVPPLMLRQVTAGILTNIQPTHTTGLPTADHHLPPQLPSIPPHPSKRHCLAPHAVVPFQEKKPDKKTRPRAERKVQPRGMLRARSRSDRRVGTVYPSTQRGGVEWSGGPPPPGRPAARTCFRRLFWGGSININTRNKLLSILSGRSAGLPVLHPSPWFTVILLTGVLSLGFSIMSA